MSNEAEESRDEGAETAGRLVIQRTDVAGENKLALMLADEVDRSTPAGEVFGSGIIIEVLEIEEYEDDDPVVNLGVIAGPQVRIEREERLTYVTTPKLTPADAEAASYAVPADLDVDGVERWIHDMRAEIAKEDGAIHELRMALRKAHARGYNRRNNSGHVKFEMLHNELGLRTRKREQMKVGLSDAKLRLKEQRRQRSEQSMRDFHGRFFKAAKARLSEKQLEDLINAAQEVPGSE